MSAARPAARLFGMGRRGDRGDDELVQALRDGDEQAFMSLVERYHASLCLRELGIPSEGSIAMEIVDTEISDAAERAAGLPVGQSRRAAGVTAATGCGGQTHS
jgi:hypothetical protein